jgi:hypothetical protein
VTVSKAVTRKAQQADVNALQTYLTSLLYLRQEAKRDGLDVVAAILWEALGAIENWLDTGEAPVSSHDVLDSPLCHSLDFLLNWVALSPARQQQVAQDIARYEVKTTTDKAAPRLLARVSKKRAN